METKGIILSSSLVSEMAPTLNTFVVIFSDSTVVTGSNDGTVAISADSLDTFLQTVSLSGLVTATVVHYPLISYLTKNWDGEIVEMPNGRVVMHDSMCTVVFNSLKDAEKAYGVFEKVS